MFVTYTYTENNSSKSPTDLSELSTKTNYGQLDQLSFCAIPNINVELETNIWLTSIDSTTFNTTMLTTFNELTTFLNAKTTGYTWTLDYDYLTVTHASAFTVTENYFSSLILGCEDFTTSATSHTFNYIGLFPYSRHVIENNNIFSSKEMNTEKKYYSSFLIVGSEFWNGKVVDFDATSILNQKEDRLSTAAFSQTKMNVGVILNNEVYKRIALRKTRPFTIKFYFENSEF